jgi:hypothetical protein
MPRLMRRVAIGLAATLGLALVVAGALEIWLDYAPYAPTILWRGTPEQIQAAGRKAAEADLAAGRPRVAIAGTEDPGPVGYPPDSCALVASLPRVPLPIGCTRRLAIEAVDYALG